MDLVGRDLLHSLRAPVLMLLRNDDPDLLADTRMACARLGAEHRIELVEPGPACREHEQVESRALVWFERSLRADAPSTDVADGFTEDQQFFLSFAQAWCSKARPEYEAMLATIDTHSPPRWRVNGTLSATPDFAKAFRCKAGAKLRPQNACAVW